MAKPKVERGWMAWHELYGFTPETFRDTKVGCDNVCTENFDIHHRSMLTIHQVEIRPITKKKGVKK